MGIDVAAFYVFTPLPRFEALRQPLLDGLRALGVKGSILLAREGVNGTIAAAPADLPRAITTIRTLAGLSDFEVKYSASDTMPFKRLKVRLKKEIVTIGDVEADPSVMVGQYVEPRDWNDLISDPTTILIDTRNGYEVRIGTFANAIDPGTASFSEFPQFVRERLAARPDARIAMFCTGGIRCEKASSFMRHEGFANVFHLKGGILKYLELIPRDESLWQGECFVFDERVAVTHGLRQGSSTMCFGCLEPVTADERNSALYEEGVCCPRCAGNLTESQKASNRERQRQVALGIRNGSTHLGPRSKGGPAEKMHQIVTLDS